MPHTVVVPSPEDEEKLLSLLGDVEELDAVANIYTNHEASDAGAGEDDEADEAR